VRKIGAPVAKVSGNFPKERDFMYFEKNNQVAASKLDFRRVSELVNRHRYVHDHHSEVGRLVSWMRKIVLKHGEKYVWENRDRLIHSWMTGQRFSYGLSPKERRRIAEGLHKRGRSAAAESYFKGAKKKKDAKKKRFGGSRDKKTT
jgi:hypothetical protein